MIAWMRRRLTGHNKPDLEASKEAFQRSRRGRLAAEARQPDVDEAVAPIRRALRENHLRERIEQAFRGAPS